MTESQPPSRLIVALGWITATAAVIAAALGLLALVGHLVPLPAAVLTGPWWPRIGPTTALGLVTAAASLWLQRGATVRLPVRRAAQLLAVVAGTLGLLTLAGWIFGSSVGLDRLLAHPTSLAPRAAPLTRSTPNAALVLCLLGIALFTLRDLRPSRWVVFLASTLTAAFVSLITLLGYIYGAQQLFRFPTHRVFPGMGAHTAAALALLCLGCLCARPDRGPAALLVRASRGGTIARRLALVTLALPLAIGLAA